MPGLVPGISRSQTRRTLGKHMDGRNTSGHDGRGYNVNAWELLEQDTSRTGHLPRPWCGAQRAAGAPSSRDAVQGHAAQWREGRGERNGELAGVSAMKRRARPCRHARRGRVDPTPRARPFPRARQARSVVTSVVEDGRRPTFGIPLIPLNPAESRIKTKQIRVPPASRRTRKARRLVHRRFQSGAEGSTIPGAAPRCAPGRMR